MSLIHYSIAGVTASIAAISGVYLQITLSQPGGGEEDMHGETEVADYGVKLPQIAVPIYSLTEKVGYCVMGVEYDSNEISAEDANIVVPRVTNDLYIEFGSALPENVNPVEDCASRAGKHTDKFMIYEAEFYEKINAAGEGEE